MMVNTTFLWHWPLSHRDCAPQKHRRFLTHPFLPTNAATADFHAYQYIHTRKPAVIAYKISGNHRLGVISHAAKTDS